MATNTVVGSLTCSDGTTIPLKTEIAEGTESDLKTDEVYTVSSMNVGDYKPGGIITAGAVTCDNGVAFCYILSQGLVAALIPFGIKGVTQDVPALCKPYRLQAGDKVRVLSNTAADREATLSVYTASGVSRIFHVTPTGGATNELIDLQTSNSIGDTLQGERIVKWVGASVDGSKIETNGFYVVDALGNVVGACPATDPGENQPQFSAAYNVPVNLNFKAQFLTNA
jgi:hypothetical protein